MVILMLDHSRCNIEFFKIRQIQLLIIIIIVKLTRGYNNTVKPHYSSHYGTGVYMLAAICSTVLHTSMLSFAHFNEISK